MVKFGERIRELGKRLGIDDVVIANKIGVSKSTMSHYVNENRKVPSEVLQKLVSVFEINPQFLFCEEAPLYKEKKITVPAMAPYNYYPVDVAAGLPENVDLITEQDIQQIHIPDVIMGKHANQADIYFMKINGDSMNNIMPHGSLIAIKPINLADLQNEDVVVFSDNYEYSTKRFINDKENERFIFRPDSSDRSYSEHHIPYSNATDLKIHGKVVLHIVDTD